MAIADADFKLRESKFFLDRLVTEDRELVRNEPEEFEYYLSAFMSAAYSVFDMLQAVDKHKVSDWVKSLPPEEDSLLKALRQKRGASVHEMKFKLTRGQREVLAETVPGVTVFGPRGVPRPTMVLPVYSIPFKGRSSKNVVMTCRHYVKLLRSLRGQFGG